MKEKITISTIAATAGYFVVSLHQNNEDKAKPFTKEDVLRVPVVGWLINNEITTWEQGKKETKYVWAEPICCEVVNSGISLFILAPDGSVMEPECAWFESIDKWITYENEEKLTKQAPVSQKTAGAETRQAGGRN